MGHCMGLKCLAIEGKSRGWAFCAGEFSCVPLFSRPFVIDLMRLLPRRSVHKRATTHPRTRREAIQV